MDLFFNFMISTSIWLTGLIHSLYKKHQQFKFDQRLQKNLYDFKPEPLIETKHLKNTDLDDNPVEKRLIGGNDCIDLIRIDFLSFSKNETIRKKSADIIRTYGVGTCGPRSFFGSSEMHKIAEKKMAAFYGVDMCLIYSYGYLTTGSVIGTYLAAADVAFIDEFSNLQIKTGLQSTRCTIYTFRHNDPSDLNNLLEMMSNHSKMKSYKGRFLILEGIYESTGAMCKLKDIVRIAKTYKIRIILDESFSFGVLGTTGRGITEYLHVSNDEIDVFCGSLENAFGTIGGFSLGSLSAIKNQYMLSLGFVYSASLSVFFIQSILSAMEMMDDRPITLQLFAREVHDYLKEFDKEFDILSHFDSPIKVFLPKISKNLLDSIQDDIVKIFIRKFKVYTKRNKHGICMHLNYDLFTKTEAKKVVYKALKYAARIIRERQ